MTSPGTQDLARAVREYLAALTETTPKPWNEPLNTDSSDNKETEQ